MWAVVGLEGGWAGLGRPSHCSPPPFPPTDKLWFCCLSPNHKVLQYGDVEEGVGPPTPESLPEQREEGIGAGRHVLPRAAPPRGRQGSQWSTQPFSCSSCGRHQGTADRQGLTPRPGERLWEAKQGEFSGHQGCFPLAPAQRSWLPCFSRTSVS